MSTASIGRCVRGPLMAIGGRRQRLPQNPAGFAMWNRRPACFLDKQAGRLHHFEKTQPDFAVIGRQAPDRTANRRRSRLCRAALLPLAGLLAGLATPAKPEGLTLSGDGVTAYTVVVSGRATDAERFALTEWTQWMTQATGVDWPVVDESAFEGGPAIYLGWTDFAEQQGVALASLGQEEWVLRSVGDALIVAGGRPRGTLYAVYEFLEQFAGVRFLDETTTHVPDLDELVLPRAVNIRGEPAFRGFRGIENYTSPHNAARVLFKTRTRLNSGAYGRRRGFAFRYGRPGANHTFLQYGEALDDPEHWALNAHGRRVKQHLDFCQSNPDVRRHFADQLREYIRLDRKEIDQAGLGEPYPVYYDISANDAGDGRCYCDHCKAVAERYGAYSGLLLEVINHIAEDIAEDYPEIIIQTFAYKYTMEPPTGIRPRDNVLIRMAFLTSDMPSDGQEKLRPFEDPVNAAHRRRIEGWSAIADRLGFWTYWEMFQASRTWPRSLVGCLGPDLRFLHRHGVQMYFTEARPTSFYNFVNLTIYLGSKLLVNPEQDDRELVEEFMRLYYGPAAAPMLSLLDHIETRQMDDPGRMTRIPLVERKAFDRAFFLEAEDLLSTAETLAGDDAEVLRRIRVERIPVDEAWLWLWYRVEAEGPLPLERETVLERHARNQEDGFAFFGVAGTQQQRARDTLDYLRHMPPVPAQFAGKRIRDITWPMFQQGANASRLMDDPDAAGGRALRLDATMRDRKADEHDKLPVFGLHYAPERDIQRVMLTRDQIPMDEQYHWYFVGRTTSGRLPRTSAWVHHSWMISPTLRVAANELEQDPDMPKDVYVSLKFEGPAYVPGSDRIDALSLDRIILIERTADDPKPTPGERL